MQGPLLLAQTHRAFLDLRHRAALALAAAIGEPPPDRLMELPPLPLPCPRSVFDEVDLQLLAEGNLAAVFGTAYTKHGLNPALRLEHRAARRVEIRGSTIFAEADDCQVDELATELLQFFLLYIGVHTLTRDGIFCRGGNSSDHSERPIPAGTYQLDVRELTLSPEPVVAAELRGLAPGLVIRVLDAKRGSIELPSIPAHGAALFDERHIHELTVGSIEACCGPDFAIFEGRRGPRLPNGDLQLVSRVVEVHGTRGDFSAPSHIIAELDVPLDAWFYAGDELPFAIVMEIGLQPCGFLSFWLGSTFNSPDRDYRFRNLDGSGTLLRAVDLRRQTVRTRVDLLSSISLSGMIVQNFGIELSCRGEPFYRGQASCGYFDSQALLNQAGLDSGRRVQPWDAQSVPAVELDVRGQGRLDLLDSLRMVEDGGKFGAGYVFGEHRVSPFDWYYANHFYQDPVMPGSLGVQAMVQALKTYAREVGLARSQRFALARHQPTTWKYRGQILPTHERLSLDVHVKRIERRAEGTLILADGSLWGDSLRIYEVADLALILDDASGTV